MKKKTLFALIIFLFSSQLKAEDLREVLQLALDNNYSYRSSIEKYNANSLYTDIAGSYLLPRLDLTGNYTKSYTKRDYNNDGTNKSNVPAASIELTFNQPIYNKEAWNGYSKARLTAEQAKLQLDTDTNNIFVQTIEKYFNVLSANDDLYFIQSQIATLKAQMQEVQSKVKVGNARVVDIEEVKAEYESAVASEVLAKNTLATALNDMNNWVGKDIKKYYKVTDNIENVYKLEGTLPDWQALGQRGNLDILTSELALQIADEDIKISSAGYYPTLAFVASTKVTKSRDPSFDNNKYTERNAALGLQLNMNLYAGGSVRKTTLQSQANKKSTEYDLRLLQQNIDNLVLQYYTNVEGGVVQLNALKQAVYSTDKVLESMRRSYEVGLKTDTDVLIAAENHYDAKRNFSQMKYKYLLSILTLKSAVGTLKVEDIEQINSFLEK